ncbi:MAG: hypothetical protein HXY40_16755 [Chloroflexi bacterium]|nr:hypothetical protein [Chloroflexota bacterium]
MSARLSVVDFELNPPDTASINWAIVAPPAGGSGYLGPNGLSLSDGCAPILAR